MRGVPILFEVEISSRCGVYFLGGIVFYMGGGVAIFSRGMATSHIEIVYLLVKDI